jgi:UDP-glucose 4-epimerase
MSRVVLVTGGAGFIGSHLVERLCRARERVGVIDDLSRGRLEWLHSPAEFYRADVRDAVAMREAVERVAPEVVVHLAAMHFIPAVDGAPELAHDVNVNGTQVLLAALAERPPRLVLFASTGAVYPDRGGPIDEACPAGPLDLYGRTKLAGEQLVCEFAERTGARCTIARIFNVIGPRETNAHVVPELVGQLRAGAATVRLGNLEPKRDYTDVRDVAAALHALMDVPADRPRIVNVGSGRSVSVGDLVRECERVLGRPVEVETDRSRRRTRDRAELVADPRRLEAATGWKPAWSLHDTLAELLDEMKEAS